MGLEIFTPLPSSQPYMMNSQPLFFHRGHPIKQIAFQALVRQLASQLSIDAKFGAHTVDPILLNAALNLASENRLSMVLIPESCAAADAQALAEENNCRFILVGTRDSFHVKLTSIGGLKVEDPFLGVFTSGTSGVPKLVYHDWDRIQLASKKVPERLWRKNWLMCYSPSSFAGLQVFFSAFSSGGTLHYADSDFFSLCRIISDSPIHIISATPSFWRLLITSWPPDQIPPVLDQATVGGEIVGQDILDLICEFFRPRKLTHIYASTEAGSVIGVSDGREGFPVTWLAGKEGVQVRIRNNLLEVSSKSAMKQYATKGSRIIEEPIWIRTPDIVEIRGDRVIFLGRADGIINVGGTKVMPEQVERVISSIDGISDCHVYNKDNPVTGSLLAADVVQETVTWTIPDLKAEIRKRLQPTHVPQYIRFVSSVAISPTGKKTRVQ